MTPAATTPYSLTSVGHDLAGVWAERLEDRELEG